MLRQLLHALFDMIRQLQTVLRMKPLELFLADRLFRAGPRRGVLRALAALDRFFESLLKIHDLDRC